MALRITARMCSAPRKAPRVPRRCGAPRHHMAPRPGWARGPSHTCDTLCVIAPALHCSRISCSPPKCTMRSACRCLCKRTTLIIRSLRCPKIYAHSILGYDNHGIHSLLNSFTPSYKLHNRGQAVVRHVIHLQEVKHETDRLAHCVCTSELWYCSLVAPRRMRR